MGDEGEDTGPKYQLLVKEDGDVRDTSKHFIGLGVATHLNGDTYDGSFQAGKRDGYGEYVWAINGDQYSGGYQENKRHGLGKFTFSSKPPTEEEQEAEESSTRGGNYHGMYKTALKWDDGKMHGNGTFYYTNGDLYSGDWENGKKNGQGTYRYAMDGSSLHGRWEDGYFLQGQWKLPNGVMYVGSFKWNQPIGEGVWVFANGNQLHGRFVQTEEREEDEVLEDEEGNPLV